ncbi:MAG: phage holin family protein [Sphingomonas sp.]|nr:phage holin family protein [Sphingomonas sp.]
MLKPTGPIPPGGERPIGEIVSDLVDEGKAYARAELEVGKAIAASKANDLKTPLILLGAAMFVGMAALNALAVAIFISLAMLMKPIFAGLLAFLLIAGAAGVLGWLGVQKLRNP